MTETVVTRSTSRSTAVASDIILREKDSVRLLFRPLIVDNPNDPNECVKGTFIYQKRKKDQPWEDFKNGSVQGLKPSEGISLEIKSSELLKFCKEVFGIYRLAKQHGVLYGTHEFVLTNSNIAGVFKQIMENPNYLTQIVHSNGAHFLNESLKWLSTNIKSEDAQARLLSLDPESLNYIESALSISKITASLKAWEGELEVNNEEHWQATFQSHPWMISQILPYPVILFKDKAYVGGKSIDNTHGNIIDFLYKNKLTENSVLIEIKTPSTKILGAQYRANCFSMSSELTGGINQLLSYRDSLMKESSHLISKASEDLRVYYPKCMLIIGCFKKEMDTEVKIRTFENFRTQMSNVEIVTFDEIIDKAKNLLSMLGLKANG